MALTAISHQVDDQTGCTRITYDELCTVTWLSRAKLSAGLDVLVQRGQVERNIEGRSSVNVSRSPRHAV
jgi:hypothetical protein